MTETITISRNAAKLLRAAGHAILRLGYTDDRPDDKGRLAAAIREVEQCLMEPDVQRDARSVDSGPLAGQRRT